MPKKQVSWKPEHAQALLKGFREHGWDPNETSGKTINATIRSVPSIYDDLKDFFSKSEAGMRPNNNGLYGHYKNQGSEYITFIAAFSGGTRIKPRSTGGG